jgi:polyisoprenoid-binding protein YceI
VSIDVQNTLGVQAGTWNIDPSHSEIGFTARHLMSKVRGLFEKFEGQIVTSSDPFPALHIISPSAW